MRFFISTLSHEFDMNDLGRLHHFLGLSIIHYQDGLFLSQSQYATYIIHRANMSVCNPYRIPTDFTGQLSTASRPPVSDPTLYRSLAGALQYLTSIRPDIFPMQYNRFVSHA